MQHCQRRPARLAHWQSAALKVPAQSAHCSGSGTAPTKRTSPRQQPLPQTTTAGRHGANLKARAHWQITNVQVRAPSQIWVTAAVRSVGDSEAPVDGLTTTSPDGGSVKSRAQDQLSPGADSVGTSPPSVSGSWSGSRASYVADSKPQRVPSCGAGLSSWAGLGMRLSLTLPAGAWKVEITRKFRCPIGGTPAVGATRQTVLEGGTAGHSGSDRPHRGQASAVRASHLS
jgi:hypothetical protein